MKVLRDNSKRLFSLLGPVWKGKGLMVGIAKKLQLWFPLQKTDFPLAFLLRCAEPSLDRGIQDTLSNP